MGLLLTDKEIQTAGYYRARIGRHVEWLKKADSDCLIAKAQLSHCEPIIRRDEREKIIAFLKANIRDHNMPQMAHVWLRKDAWQTLCEAALKKAKRGGEMELEGRCKSKSGATTVKIS